MLRKQALICIAALAFSTAAAGEPRPPCESEIPVPSYATLEQPPNVQVWTELPWRPPACLGWKADTTKLVVALAAAFRHSGPTHTLLERFGAISTLRGLRYWSVTDEAWRELISDAAALAVPEAGKRRADFSAAELAPGTTVYFEQTERRTGTPVVYRLRVLAASQERLVVATDNVTAIRAFSMTLFPPGSLRATYLLARRDADVWNFYGISAVSEEASALAMVSPPSYLHRATALYRHFAGFSPSRP